MLTILPSSWRRSTWSPTASRSAAARSGRVPITTCRPSPGSSPRASTSRTCATSARSRTAPSWRPTISAATPIWWRSLRYCWRSNGAGAKLAIRAGASRCGPTMGTSCWTTSASQPSPAIRRSAASRAWRNCVASCWPSPHCTIYPYDTILHRPDHATSGFRELPRSSQAGASAVMRLSLSALERLPAEVARPIYDMNAVRIGIVHLGIGAFHRAHQAVYVDDRLAAGETDWGICGASLRSPETSDALDPQDGLYTVAIRSGVGEHLRLIGAVRKLLVAPQNPEALLDAMTDPAVRIVSLTVTEKGYCHDPATGQLREDHPEIAADLAQPHLPRTTPGYVVEALRRRRAAGVLPFTVLCCDNLPANGHTVARVVGRFAALRNPALGRFVEPD